MMGSKRGLHQTIFAGTILMVLPNITLAQDLVQAGVSAAVRGTVQLARVDTVGIRVNSGEEIFLNDAITSGTASGMQIMLLDQTIFSIGPESEISIDTFVYDPASAQGTLAASMTKGVMRFVTGSISSGNPQSMTIKLPVGTIGIRGTTGTAAVLTPAQMQQTFPEQQSQLGAAQGGQPVVFAALTGPGPNTQTGVPGGSFNFSSPDGSVDLNRPGGAVLATLGQPPVFFIATPDQLTQINNSITARPDGSGDAAGADGTDTNASNESGTQSDSAGGGASTGSGDAVASSNVSNDTAFNQVQTVSTNTLAGSQASTIATDAGAANSSATTFGAIAAANGGSGTLSGSGSLSGAITGDISTFFNFSSRTFDIQFSDLDGSGLSNGTFGINGGSTTLSDSATGVTIGSGQQVPSQGCSSCTASVTFTGTNSLSTTLNHAGGSGSGSVSF